MLGRVPLAEPGCARVQEMFDHLMLHGSSGVPLSPNTLNRIRATLRAGSAPRRGRAP
jgi:hypothetical protein